MEVETAAAIVPEAAVAAPEAPAPSSAPEAVAPVQADQAASVAAPVADATPPAPAADADTKPAAAEPVPDLLDKFEAKQAAKDAPPAEAPKVEAAPAEVKPVEEAKPAEVPPEPEKAPVAEPVKLDPIDWYAEEGGLKIPETLKLDDDTRPKLTAALETFRTDPAKGAQELIDLGSQAVADAATALHTQMWTDWSDTRKEWNTRVMADPELGGAGHDTAMGRVARMRDMFVSRHAEGTPAHEKDWNEFKEFMQVTGAGDHPAFHRLMHNVSRKFDEASAPPPNPKPPADLGRKPGARGKLNYTHPSSQPDH